MKKILFIVSEDWYFVSHRVNLAKSAIEKGYQVTLLSRMSVHEEYIKSIGINTINWPIDRKSRNPFKELKSVYFIIKTVKSTKPDLLYSVAIKPVLYSILSNYFLNVKAIVLALAGLGFIFRSEKFSAKLIRFFIVWISRIFLVGANVRLIVQNKDDMNLIKKLKIISSNKIRIVRGAGVNTGDFYSTNLQHKIPLIILPGRMLWDKGVGDFVRCAKKFVSEKNKVRFALVGEPDTHNPESVPEKQLHEWEEMGYIEYWGRQDNMLEVYNSADLVCFPSYHEGLPLALLEAASCELPIVAYDVSGCREVVINNENGFLVPFRDEYALFTAVKKLIENSSLRHSMGQIGRQIVMENFTDKIITSETIAIWREAIE